MQSRQPAFAPAVQVDRAGAAVLSGSDAWSRSAGLVIVALAIVGILFVGALVLLYFGAVQPSGARDAVARAPAAPTPIRVQPVVPAPAAAASPAPMPAAAAAETRVQVDPKPAASAPAHVEASAGTPAAERATRSASNAEHTATRSDRPVAPAPTVEREARTAQPVQRAAVAPPVELRVNAPLRETAAPLAVDKTGAVDAPAAPARLVAPAAETAPAPVAALDPAPARVAQPAPRADPAPAARPEEPPPEALPPVTLRPVSRRQPQFPPQALREGVTRGSVLARVSVATDGSVSAVTIVASNPPRLFDRAAQTALAEWRFEPIPRPASAQIELLFRSE